MTRLSNAKVMNLKKLNVIYRARAKHPLVDKLLYIQTQVREGAELPYYLYPCYLVDVEIDKKTGNVKNFVLDIVQRVNGQHGIARIRVPLSGMGKTWQMWNNPPSEKVLFVHPLKSDPLPMRKPEDEKVEEVKDDDEPAGKEAAGDAGKDEVRTDGDDQSHAQDRGYSDGEGGAGEG